ncbi:MAG: ATP-dependent sacrificial sulfur transferase LarE [Pirellulaceae bacterium]|nr:ATP-dependent sacrificial sulfur transferase LarE [Pirellulaceae bacterium]
MSLPDHSQVPLFDWFRPFRSCIVAFSGGVDSAVVAYAARQVLGSQALAVTAVSPSLAEGELAAAERLAGQIGIVHRSVRTGEWQRPEYVRNGPDRCYHCKTELYTRLDQLAAELAADVVVSGANADDLSDYRPGLQAAREHRVRSPLAECGLTKADVRELARQWQLEVWDKPAMPCLSSRVAYGEPVTPERLRMIDLAEQYLRQRGWRDIRVRYHGGDLARLEVPAERLAELCDDRTRRELVEHLQRLGFRFVTLDLEGFRSGSLNVLVPVEQLLPRSQP